MKLAAIAFSVTFGFVVSVVLAGSTYKDLEGPVFGTRAGIYSLGPLDQMIQCPGNATSPVLEDATLRVALYQTSRCLSPRWPSNAEDLPAANHQTMPTAAKGIPFAEEPTAFQRKGSDAFLSASVPLPLAFLRDSAAFQRVGVRTVNDSATHAATLDRIPTKVYDKPAALDEECDEPSVIPKADRLSVPHSQFKRDCQT